jgi:hypothetical protein
MTALSGIGETSLILEVGLVLLALVGLLAVLAKRAKRAFGGAGSHRVGLTAHHAVHVVELEGRRLVVGTGPTGAPRLLCELEAAIGRTMPEVVADRPRGGWSVGG